MMATQTRLELDLSGTCTHTVFTMHNPERLVIDIPDATLRGRLPLAPGDHPTLAGLRSGIRAGDDLRMVVDLKQGVRTKTFLLKPDAEGGHRLVVNLTPTAAPARAQVTGADAGPETKATQPGLFESAGAQVAHQPQQAGQRGQGAQPGHRHRPRARRQGSGGHRGQRDAARRTSPWR